MSTVLVLNSDYTPLNVTSVQRGFVLVTKGKAEVLRSGENPIISGYNTHIRPIIIRLLKYIRFRTRLNKPNRSRIYKRDGHECVYCGSKKNLTLDHVIPKSRGGTNDWTNLVTCCSKCNRDKDNKTPDEAKMKMLKQAFEPPIMYDDAVLFNVWNEFKKSFV